MRYSDPKLVEHLASHYALGSLSAGARRRFESLLRDRSDLRLAVRQWQDRLNLLETERASAMRAAGPASPGVWRAIAARTRPASSRLRNLDNRRPPASWLSGLWIGLGSFAAGCAALVALIALMPTLFVTTDQIALRSNERLPQSYVGLLTNEQGVGRVLVSSLRHGRTMTIKMLGAPLTVAAGSLVLWAEPDIGPAFVLGTLPMSGTQVTQLADTSERLLSKVSRLKVTLETSANPATPTGPIILRGNCAKLC
jgi:anti-sigma-K factor RskA